MQKIQSQGRGGRSIGQKKRGEQVRPQGQKDEKAHAQRHNRHQRRTQEGGHPGAVPRAPVDADDGRQGIAYAVKHGKTQQSGVIDHGKGRHPVGPQATDENAVEKQNDDARRNFVDKFGSAVPSREQHLAPAPPGPGRQQSIR